MHVADGPIGVMRQTVDRLDRHQGAFKGAHAVKSHGDHQHAQDRVGAQLVPGPRQGHQTVDHAAPGRHPQHHREDHAEGLRPIGQGGIV